MGHGIAARVLLRCFQHGAGLRVINNDGPELFCWNFGWHLQDIALGPVKETMLIVPAGHRILRTDTHHLQNDCRSVDGSQIEKPRPSVKVAASRPSLNQPLVVPSWKERFPLTLLTIDPTSFRTRREANRSRRCVANDNGLGEEALHALVRLEWLAFANADSRQVPAEFWLKELHWFTLDHSIHLLIEPEIIRVDGVHDPPGAPNHFGRGWIANC
mmetsp:Transcript_30797/g.57728  ORF Transcript_30797/g.57728 Transcript_30797/m.57728 type:complete len:215 (+) Transcript_30797:350-994(+)